MCFPGKISSQLGQKRLLGLLALRLSLPFCTTHSTVETPGSGDFLVIERLCNGLEEAHVVHGIVPGHLVDVV